MTLSCELGGLGCDVCVMPTTLIAGAESKILSRLIPGIIEDYRPGDRSHKSPFGAQVSLFSGPSEGVQNRCLQCKRTVIYIENTFCTTKISSLVFD